MSLSLPSIVARITSIIMQYIDAAMVGRLGANASAAIGLVASSTWLFGSLCTSLVSGFSIQVAQCIGAKKFQKAREILWESYFMVIAVAVILSVIGIGISHYLPAFLGSDPILWRDASRYFMVYAGCLPVMSMNSLAGAMLQCSGNMKIPGVLNSMMCVLDVLFNALFIFPSRRVRCFSLSLILPGLDMGVFGAAVGTALAAVITMCVMVYFLWRRTPLLHRRKQEKRHFVAKDIYRAIHISLPIAFEHLVVCGAMIVTTRIVAPLGVVSIAANSFAVTAESLCYMPGFGIAEAATTLVGQSYGADRRELAFSFGRITISSGMALMALMGILMYVAAPWMMGLLTPDQQVRLLGVKILRIEAFAEPLYGASIVTTGVFRGAGDTLLPSIMNFVSLWCVRIVLSFLLVQWYGLAGVWTAMCAELCFRGLIFLYRFNRRRWLRE